MESTFDKEITLDCLQKIKDIPAMIPVVKKIISDLGHRSASFAPRVSSNCNSYLSLGAFENMYLFHIGKPRTTII